jgi:hypothetical protein
VVRNCEPVVNSPMFKLTNSAVVESCHGQKKKRKGEKEGRRKGEGREKEGRRKGEGREKEGRSKGEGRREKGEERREKGEGRVAIKNNNNKTRVAHRRT